MLLLPALSLEESSTSEHSQRSQLWVEAAERGAQLKERKKRLSSVSVDAEGYPAAEMKHGPIALIDQRMPVVVIAPRSDPNYKKLQSNIEEVLARGGAVG